MNILLVCNKFPSPPRDGGSLASFNMAKGLVQAGNKVDLLAMNTSKHYSFRGLMYTGIPGVTEVRRVYVDTTVSYKGIIGNLFLSPLPYTATRFISREFRRVLAEMLRENAYDIVQLEGLYMAPYVHTIRAVSDAMIIYRAHNIEHYIWESYHSRQENILKKWYLGKLYSRIRDFEQEFVNRYDLLVPLTRVDLNHLNVMGNNKPAMVAPFGMYPEEFPSRAKSSNGDICLQYIGALDWLPNTDGLDWFIQKVWHRLKAGRSRLRFTVAGRNAKRDYAAYLVKNGIDFRGEVGGAPEYLSKSGIFIVPLFSGSGIRVKIIEAMFLGKPIVATSLAVTGIPVENGKHILLADNEDSFADSVEMMLNDPEFAFRLGTNARDLAHEHFNNRVITGKLSSFYKKSLK